MRLELGKIFIKDVQFGEKTEVKDGVLFINKEEMLHLFPVASLLCL